MDQMTQQLILDANADEQQKLERLIDTLLTHHNLVVLFDNFEDNQTTDGAIIQPQLSDFLSRLIQRLPETTLVLFTTRYQMTELPVAEVNLGEFPFADTWKKMNRLAKLGSLATDNKRDIHYEIGGQPRSLELLDSILAETETSWVAIKGKLVQVKKEAYDDLFLDILWGNLTPEAQNLLQWLSLFRAPMAEVELRKFSEFQLNPPDLASLQRMSLLFSVAVSDGGTWHFG